VLTSPDGRYSLAVSDDGILLEGPLSTIVLDDTGIGIDSGLDVTVASGGGRLEIDGSGVDVSGTRVDVDASTSLELEGAGSVALESSGTATVNGSIIKIGGTGCLPAARQTDPVSVEPTTGLGTILTGASTVLIC